MDESRRHPLAQWIELHGLKQVEAAEKLGVSESYLSQVLSYAKTNISLGLLSRWSEITGLPMEAFKTPSHVSAQ